MQTTNLVGVGKTSHTTHDAKDIVVGGVDTDRQSWSQRWQQRRRQAEEWRCRFWRSCKFQMAGAPQRSEGVDIDTSVGVSGVVLERLNEVEVGTLTLREAVLTVKLELSGNNRVLTPAVHLAGSLGEDEGTGIRDTVVVTCTESTANIIISGADSNGRKITSGAGSCSWVVEKTAGIDNTSVSTLSVAEH